MLYCHDQGDKGLHMVLTVLALLWLCSGPALALLLWLCSGTVLALVWLCSGTGLALLWLCSGSALTLLWLCSVPWHCCGYALAMLRP